MTENQMEANRDEDIELVITRDFAAPRAKVFAALTEAEHLRHWWGPTGFTMEVARVDLRPGGLFHYKMSSPDGNAMWGRFVYREISAPEKLIFVNAFSDEEGGVVRAPFHPAWPLEVRNTLTFMERNGTTTLVMRGIPDAGSPEELQIFKEGHELIRQGFSGTLDQLADYLTKI
ncbi:SRPBCC family protein [Ferroacidibacillus organovorans]|nr:SRPBCC domain-containing protein [Ferroacidibacillus organovorans]